MRSVEDLTDAIRTPTGRMQFREAMQAYSAGANRAATIMLWTAVTQDFSDKLRVLADAGDNAAEAEISRIDGARSSIDTRRMQNFENSLLGMARERFEFITDQEAKELERLREDRNLCAHPSFQSGSEEFFTISAEQVRAYARLVVESVLSQPPIVGKALVSRFMSDIESDSWPGEDLADFLRTRYIDRARSGVMRNILEVAVKHSIRPPGNDNRIAGRCVATIKAAAEIDAESTKRAIAAVLTKWHDTLTDDDLLHVVGAIGAYAETWRKLDPANQARLKELIKSAPTEKLINERAFASGFPAELELQDIYREAISRLGPDQLDEMSKEPYEKAQLVPMVLDEVQDVQNWRGGERAIRLAIRVASGMTLSDISVVAGAFESNDQIHHAADVPQLLLKLINQTLSVTGARDVWQKALDAYSNSRDPRSGAEDYYSYSEAREALGRSSILG